MNKDVERLAKHLASGIATAKGVDGDFVYITVGDAKRILRMICEREPEAVYGMKLNGRRLSGYCPNCSKRLDNVERLGRFSDPTNFCSTCGQAVKWE